MTRKLTEVQKATRKKNREDKEAILMNIYAALKEAGLWPTEITINLKTPDTLTFYLEEVAMYELAKLIIIFDTNDIFLDSEIEYGGSCETCAYETARMEVRVNDTDIFRFLEKSDG